MALVRRKRPSAESTAQLFSVLFGNNAGSCSVQIQRKCMSFPSAEPQSHKGLTLSDAQLFRLALEPASASASLPPPPLTGNEPVDDGNDEELSILTIDPNVDCLDIAIFSEDLVSPRDDYEFTELDNYAFDWEDSYIYRNTESYCRLEHKKHYKKDKVNTTRSVSARAMKKELAKVDLELHDQFVFELPRSYDTPLTPVRIHPIREKRLIRDNTPAPAVSAGLYYTGPPAKSSRSSNRAPTDAAAIRAQERRYEQDLRRAVTASTSDKHASGLTLQQLLDLSNRDLTPEDYELLLQLDSTVQKKTVKATTIAKLDERLLGAEDDCISKQETCSVCLCNYAAGEKVKVLPCTHLFHCTCIVPWLEAHSQACPMCNAKLTS